jgi:hypothetical protein
MSKFQIVAIAAALTFGLAAGAHAESPCKGAVPQAGAVFRGPVLHVEEGGRLCVARGFEPDAWVEVQLADAPPELTRGTLMSTAFAKDVDCRMGDGGRAACTVDGQPLGALLRQPLAQKAGFSWR